MIVTGSASRTSRKLFMIAGCAAVSGFLLLLALSTLSWPFGWDQGIYAWVGDVIVNGGLPYRDAWVMKTPLVYYTFAFAQILFGQHLFAIRLLDLILFIATSSALGAVVGRRLGWQPAVGAAVLLVLWYFSGTYWHTAEPDGWVAMIMTLGMTPLLLAGRPVSRWRYIVAGGLIGLVVLYKQLYAVFLLVPVLALLLDYRATAKREQTTPANKTGLMSNYLVAGTFLILAFVLPVILTVWWFVSQLTLKGFMDAVVNYPAEIYVGLGVGGVGARMQGLLDYLLAIPLLLVLSPAIVFGAIETWREDRVFSGVVLCWLGLALAAIVIQGRYFNYHWIPAIPPMVILAAYGFTRALDSGRRLVARGALGLLVISGLYAAAHPGVELARWAAWKAGITKTVDYYNAFGIPGPDIRAAEFIANHSNPDDGVVIWGWNASILFMADRKSPTRFGWSMPLMMGAGTGYREAFRKEFLCDLVSNPPRWIVVAPLSEKLLGGKFSERDFPAFARFLESYYIEQTRIADHVLMERRPGAIPDAKLYCAASGVVTH